LQPAEQSNISDRLFPELWISLASLLRSYTALHGLSGNRQAAVVATEDRIVASHGERWLRLTRTGATILWEQSNGVRGEMELTPAGRLRGPEVEEEMDMVAESWARELMG